MPQPARPGACGGSGDNGSGSDSTPTIAPASAQDINPQDRANLAEGGNLRLSVGSLAENWNPLNVNGNEADFSDVRDAMMPSMFLFDAKGEIGRAHV